MNQRILFVIIAILVGISYEEEHSHNFGEKSEIQDQEHIKQHLENRIDVEKVKMDDETQKYHYFIMHDLNKDEVIDGLEIIKSMTHKHGGQDEMISEYLIENKVDTALRQYDLNNDGVVSYTEYSIVLEKKMKQQA